MSNKIWIGLAFLALLCNPLAPRVDLSAGAGDSRSVSRAPEYNQDIRPIFAENCFA